MTTRGKEGPAAALATRALTSSSVFVRVRPITTTGDCGHTDGEAVSKKLAGFDETTLTVRDDDRRDNTTFEVTGVLGPEVEQEDTFKAMLPDLLDGFKSDTNVLFFAYGQTGSGKTHTMLGEVDSLSSAEPVPGWGIFPRVVHSTLQSMEQWRAEGVQSVLLASAVEFYCGCAFDLNSKYRDAKTEVTIDNHGQCFGMRSKEVKSIRGLRKWIHRMYANRTTAKTNMNDASSRSHCAFILTLHQLRADDMYVKTTFSMIDMAGSERSSKTGGERMSVLQASKEMAEMIEAGTPELLSIGAQGTMINFEISLITTEIMKAADVHKRGMPYKAPQACGTAASFYFSSCCDGRGRLGACVTVSQSPQHGFETWFSLKYAEQLAACRVPLVRVKPLPMAQVLQAAAEAAEEAEARFSKMDPHPQHPKQYRVVCLASGAATFTAETLQYLQRLVAQKEGQAEAEGNSESDDPWESPSAPRRVVHHAEAPQKSALEMGKINESFQVFIRVRPLNDRESRAGAANCFAISDVENFPRDPPPQRITVQDVAEADSKHSFVFNRVFEAGHGQDDVYRGAALPYVADFLDGTNVTIFAYGQTGTGKTYTIAGPSEDPGLISRCLEDLFSGLAIFGKELHYEYVQLYLDTFKDLLVAEPKGQPKLLDRDGAVHLQNVTCRRATSAEQVLRALEAGAARRATRAQDMNEVSSRSHAILALRLVEPGGDPSEAEATMFIVDLAGSERIERSGVTGKGFEEATSINQSLTSLGRVVISLIEGQKFVPYSGHPLTQVLRAGLGGNSKTALIACVTQAADSMSESLNTLRFAMQASHVKNKVAKKDDKDKADQERAALEDTGHSLNLQDGRGTIPLPTGPLEALGSWDASDDTADRVVILLGELNTNPEVLQDLIDALARQQCRVLAPKLPGTKKALLDEDVGVLLALFDWLGVAKPVIYGRDFGAVRAIKFKMCHPARVAKLVLEERASRLEPKAYKEMVNKDMMKAMGLGAFCWIWDNACPSSGDYKAGKNLAGFKGKPLLLWPMHSGGKPDPKMKAANSQIGAKVAKCLKTTCIDSWAMSDDDVASQIVSCFK